MGTVYKQAHMCVCVHLIRSWIQLLKLNLTVTTEDRKSSLTVKETLGGGNISSVDDIIMVISHMKLNPTEAEMKVEKMSSNLNQVILEALH